MKRILIMLVMLVMVTSCRVLKKNKVKADSTVARSEQVASTWDRVTVMEVFGGGSDLTPRPPLLGGVGEQDVTARRTALSLSKGVATGGFDRSGGRGAQPDKRNKKGIFKRFSQHQPTRSPEPKTLISRTTTTERGTFLQEKQEQKQVHVQQANKDVTSGMAVNPAFLPTMIALILLLLVCIILYESKRNDY